MIIILVHLSLNNRIAQCQLHLVKITKGKVMFGQEPPSGESTTTECGLN